VINVNVNNEPSSSMKSVKLLSKNLDLITITNININNFISRCFQ